MLFVGSRFNLIFSFLWLLYIFSSVSSELTTEFDDDFRFDLRRYHSFDEIQRFLQYLSRKYRSKVRLIDLDKTYQNRTLTVCKVGDRRNRHKPSIWIDAGLHSREWISIATALYFIDKIIRNDTLTKSVDFYILPVSNPDGYEYSRTKDREWRKNRSNCTSDADRCCGVDLNRNFDFDWGVTDSPHEPCSILNSGPSAASEAETRTIKKFLKKRMKKSSLKAYLTLHSYGQFWFYPYGHKKKPDSRQLPTNIADLSELASEATNAIYEASNRTVRYEIGHAGDLIYPSSGGSDDWAKGHLGVEYVFCIELPPKDDEPEQFKLPESRIESTAENLWPGLMKIVDKIVQKAEKLDERRSIHMQESIVDSKPQLYM